MISRAKTIPTPSRDAREQATSIGTKWKPAVGSRSRPLVQITRRRSRGNETAVNQNMGLHQTSRSSLRRICELLGTDHKQALTMMPSGWISAVVRQAQSKGPGMIRRVVGPLVVLNDLLDLTLTPTRHVSTCFRGDRPLSQSALPSNVVRAFESVPDPDYARTLRARRGGH